MRYCATCGLSVGDTATHCQTCGTPTGFVAAGQVPSAQAGEARHHESQGSPAHQDTPPEPVPAPIGVAPAWGGARWAEPAPPAGKRRTNPTPLVWLLIGLGLVAAVVALSFVAGGFGAHDKYTGTWRIVSATENGTPSPAPDPAVFINIKKSGDAGGDHDVWFTQAGTTPVDHLGMQVVGGHLASGGSGPPVTVTVANGTLTMTEKGYNDAGAFDPVVYKAVRN